MTKPIIHVVLFDIGNVLLRSVHMITWAILLELGVRPDRVALFFRGKHYSDFARGKLTGEQFAQAIRDALEVPHLTDTQIRAAHDAHIYMMDADVVALLELLKATDVPLAFVTTTNAWQTARELELIKLADRFGPVVRSHETQMTKTDPDAWPKILHELGWHERDPSSILLVDDATSNCAAARHAGLIVHQYDPMPDVGVTELRRALVAFGLLD